jgi:hypothetical protein
VACQLGSSSRLWSRPPNKQRTAVQNVIEQVETYAEDWQPKP